jgi:cytoskeletal protein CcmA (bactofilin family)
MWKWTQKDENRRVPMGSPVPPVRVIPSEESLQAAVQGLQSVESSDPDVTRIGKSVVIKGDISGGGSLYLDGELEGNVELNGSLTVGPQGRVRANMQARSIVVQGRVEGDLYGLEHAELKKSATVVGDIYTPCIAIEDGMSLTGSVHVNKEIPRPQTKKAPRREVA